jgi:hypothetical protein
MKKVNLNHVLARNPDPTKPAPKVGDRVFVPALNAIAEVVSISKDVTNLITEVRYITEDGNLSVENVSTLIVKALSVWQKIKESAFIKAIVAFFSSRKKV